MNKLYYLCESNIHETFLIESKQDPQKTIKSLDKVKSAFEFILKRCKFPVDKINKLSSNIKNIVETDAKSIKKDYNNNQVESTSKKIQKEIKMTLFGDEQHKLTTLQKILTAFALTIIILILNTIVYSILLGIGIGTGKIKELTFNQKDEAENNLTALYMSSFLICIVAPIFEEIGKFLSTQLDMEWINNIVFNIMEFSSYVSSGVSPKTRALPVLMHTLNTKIHSYYTEKDEPYKGFIIATIVHVMWNTVALIYGILQIKSQLKNIR